MAHASKVSILHPRQHPSRPSPKVAVLLNANARSVSDRVVRSISEVLPREDLYLSRSIEEARQIAAEVTRRGYDTVLTGGGDGTFVGYFNALREVRGFTSTRRDGSAQPALAPSPLPRMGVLRLGTGNALAGYTGASPLRRAGVLEDIVRVRSGQVGETRRLDLVETEGIAAPFAGVGLDALILNNYIRWKKLLGHGPLRLLGEGNLGYGLSIALLSLPESILRSLPEVEVVNTGAPAIPVDVDGRPTGPAIPTGAVLYRGPMRIASVGTVPNFGYGFKIFPAAGSMAGRMQLRVTAASVFETLWNLPAIWRGYYRSPSIHDFMVTAVTIRGEREMPFQVGGDAMGWRREVHLSVADEPAEVLDFRRAALPA